MRVNLLDLQNDVKAGNCADKNGLSDQSRCLTEKLKSGEVDQASAAFGELSHKLGLSLIPQSFCGLG
ncbi:MAG: hypothetical protein K2X81_14750, partial [Candidatus Obscuribacterales bacterium]|nr:hypothetical protein [Candidatus Obscuribacterales bacterium]